MKELRIFGICICVLLGTVMGNAASKLPSSVTMSKVQLENKIKGGWAGQTIGVSFGSYTEFRYQGTFIQDYQTIPWGEGYVQRLMDSWPDLYDDIDYQIEADFAGLMNPGMPNSASQISDKVGHLMCYGDGWYGGVYVGAMYSLAFVSDDIQFIVTEALKTIPEESGFYKCIADVIEWYKMYPDDWKRTWFEIQKHHAEEIGCPDGVFHPLDIDAKINAAYIVLGLLYGNGDFTKTMEISTRAGQDSDCNPSSAGGILGTMIGYDAIPEYWMKGLRGAEGKNFKYTLLCLDQIYTISNKHALEMIRRNGGKVEKENVTIAVQRPETVRLEQSFTDMYPTAKVELSKHDIDILTFEFEGTGFVLRGEAIRRDMNRPDAVLKVNLYLDGELVEKAAAFPTYFHDRRLDIFWKYQLPEGKHQVKVEVIKDGANALLKSWDYIVYSKGKK